MARHHAGPATGRHGLPKRAGRLSLARGNTGAAPAFGCVRRRSVAGQRPFVIPTTAEDAEDRHVPRAFVDGKGGQRRPLVVGHAQARPDVFARHAAQRRECQSLASGNHGTGEALRYGRGPPLGNVPEQFLELVSGLGSEDDAVGDQAFEVAFACTVASRALTASTATAHDGSDLSLS